LCNAANGEFVPIAGLSKRSKMRSRTENSLAIRYAGAAFHFTFSGRQPPNLPRVPKRLGPMGRRKTT
jgi:hypothetical protein